jgi:hypothetical protein
MREVAVDRETAPIAHVLDTAGQGDVGEIATLLNKNRHVVSPVVAATVLGIVVVFLVALARKGVSDRKLHDRYPVSGRELR